MFCILGDAVKWKLQMDSIAAVESVNMTAFLVWWLAHLTANQAVPVSIPGYTLEIFLEV